MRDCTLQPFVLGYSFLHIAPTWPDKLKKKKHKDKIKREAVAFISRLLLLCFSPVRRDPYVAALSCAGSPGDPRVVFQAASASGAAAESSTGSGPLRSLGLV